MKKDTIIALNCIKNVVEQGLATLFGLQATLETKMIYAGQYKYYMDLNDLNFERKWANNTLFSKKKHSKRGVLMFF